MDKNKTILIIDDSNTALILLEWSLTNEGYKTLIAPSVEEARKIIAENKPDLILLDLFMPEISGYDFLKMIPELNLKNIPVIVVSAYDDKESVKLTLELGAAEFISKPFSVPQIIAAVNNYFV
jgi:DNA-binding response OmpR family regulator